MMQAPGQATYEEPIAAGLHQLERSHDDSVHPEVSGAGGVPDSSAGIEIMLLDIAEPDVIAVYRRFDIAPRFSSAARRGPALEAGTTATTKLSCLGRNETQVLEPTAVPAMAPQWVHRHRSRHIVS